MWNQAGGFVEGKTGWKPPMLADAPFRLGLDLQGGTHLVYEADMKEIPQADRSAALEGVRDVIEQRVNAFGVSEPVVQTITTGGTYRIAAELAGVMDVSEAIKLIGETPVLEFKEPGEAVAEELTDAEKTELETKQKEERAKAEEILANAKAGTNFNGLVAEFSIDETKETKQGILDGIGARGLYQPIGEAIDRIKPAKGVVLPEVVESLEGLNVIKFMEPADTNEMQLFHLLVCYEGAQRCAQPIPEIEANTKINSLKARATVENFAELVKNNSTDTSSEDGALGWVVPTDPIDAVFLAAAQALKKGEISAPVKTQFGYHLIYKADERVVRTSKIQRVLLPLSQPRDVAKNVSPWKNTGLSGRQLSRATVQFNSQTGQPHVALQFDDEGGKLFGELTSKHVGETIAIFLDGQPISIPVVQEAIFGGQAIITLGQNAQLEEAKLLAQRLNAGALPVPITLLSQQTVGPTLGAVSLQKSIQAAFFGFLFVALYMLFFYRLGGLVAVVALLFYAAINLAVYRLFGVTMTLAGIAGLVLSLGMAVDANVLILERFKEEYASGRDFGSAIDEAFKRAWTAVRDGNLTTLIASGILYYFSSSFIRGFALTLSIGVILSMVSAFWISRSYLRTVLSVAFLRSASFFSTRRSTTL
ncbi:protein translocase subunit SecD [Candidatus Uhrbacteria bacterium]|nr:protein translocase subunit SecD [Candidatus Uhrbacteria bacterium]